MRMHIPKLRIANKTEPLTVENMNTQHTKSHCRILLGLLCLMALPFTKIFAADPGPENVEWSLVEINGQAEQAPAGARSRGATLKLDAAKAHASGVAFVNRYGGKYELKENALKFGPMMSTKMAGPPEAMKSEQDYHAMLKDVTGWRIADGKLELLSGEKVVARFSEKAKAAKPAQSN